MSRIQLQGLTPLHNGWSVDSAILSEEDRLVVIRFGSDTDPTCMEMDQIFSAIAKDVSQLAVFYQVDIHEVPDFNTMYELYDPCTVMFFYRNKHVMIDMGTGNSSRILWPLKDKQEMIEMIDAVNKGAKRGKGIFQPSQQNNST